MPSIAAFDYPVPDRSGIAANEVGGSISTFNNFTVSQQRSFDISLATTDCDRVTIHSSSQFEAGFSVYNRHGITDGEVVDISAGTYACSTADDFSFSVEGALDKEEAREIHKAVRQVEKFFRRLQAGDLKHAINRISKLDKLDTISGIEATLQSSRSVSSTQQAETATTTSSTIQNRETAPAADG